MPRVLVRGARAAGLAAVVVAVSACSPPPPPGKGRTLTRIGEVRALSPAQAQAGLPVLLTAVVTAEEPTLQVLTVEDASGGVLIDVNRQAPTHGQRVEVRGFTGFEGGHRIIVRPTLRVLGTERVGRGRVVPAASVLAGREDDQWIETEAELTGVETGSGGRRVLRFSLDGRPARGLVTYESVALGRLRPARVRVSAVVSTVYGPDGRPERIDLLIPNESAIRDREGRESQAPVLYPQAPGPLLKVAQLRALTPEQAARPWRVHLEGTILYLHPRRFLMFVADETGSVFLTADDPALASLRSGSRIVLDGVTGPGSFAPMVDSFTWRAAGSGPLPRPLPIEARDLSDTSLDSQWVALEGEVRGVRRFDVDAAALRLRAGDRPIEVRIPGLEGQPLPEQLLGARVRVQGVLGTRFDRARRFRGFNLLAPSLAAVSVLSPAARGHFDAPEVPIGSLLAYQPGRAVRPQRVVGTIALHRADGSFYVSDSSGGALVEPVGEGDTAEGESVEVVGYPPVQAAPVLEDALVRRVARPVSPASPTAITAEEGVGPEWEARLVRIEAHLVDARSSRGDLFLQLESGRVRFLASLEAPRAGGLTAALEPGGLLAVTGVRALRPRAGPGGDPRLFELLLRSPADVTVLRPAPWWTRRRTLGLLGSVSAAALLAFGWVIVLRRRVEAQTLEIRQELEGRAALETRLRESNRLEALGRLAGGVAHNFNNMLMMIGGSAELARRETAPEHPAHARLANIEGVVARAASLTSQLLAFGRRQLLSPRVLDVNSVLREAAHTLQSLVGARVAIETRLDPRAGAVLADPGHLDQIFFNLAANARDAMPHGGKLVLETSRLEHEASPGSAGGWVRIAFRDDGEGMTEEALRCAFEPFFSTKPPGKGTGLGLASVHGLVQQSGGRVSIESAPGRGTSVLIDLPWIGTAQAVPAAHGPVTPRAHEQPCVLLVEDEREIREALACTLADSGYAVVQASSGAEAVEWLARHAAQLDVLVTDVMMRHPDGREVARAARERRPGLPVVFVSGCAEDVLAEADTRQPGTLFLQKPFQPVRLLSAIHALLAVPRR